MSASGPTTPPKWLVCRRSRSPAIIDAAQPDVVGLHEVGSPHIFHILQGVFGHALPRVVSDLPDRREVRVAFLSRVDHRGPLDRRAARATRLQSGSPMSIRRGAASMDGTC
jgi:hypothetical protein